MQGLMVVGVQVGTGGRIWRPVDFRKAEGLKSKVLKEWGLVGERVLQETGG